MHLVFVDRVVKHRNSPSNVLHPLRYDAGTHPVGKPSDRANIPSSLVGNTRHILNWLLTPSGGDAAIPLSLTASRKHTAEHVVDVAMRSRKLPECQEI